MGMVPVAPKSTRLLFEGERRENGFNEKLDDQGLRSKQSTYMPRFT
jgi:hypothetical protein